MDNLTISIILFLLGSCLGSFANVIIYRLPKGESVVFPRSHCGSCGKMVSWYDNIPIFSWFILCGRCRKCKAKFSIRYPTVESLMGVLFALVYLKIGLSWLLVEYLIFIFGLVTVSMIDFDHMILPDVFTLSGTVIGLLGAWLNPERYLWPDSILGVLLGGGFLWAVAEIYSRVRNQEGMGGGDIKLLAWIGAVLGWSSVPFVILVSSVIGTIVGLALSFRTKEGLSYAIPFGPYLALGAVLFIFFGHEISRSYFHFFFPSLVQ